MLDLQKKMVLIEAYYNMYTRYIHVYIIIIKK
jgi:hypothetical protein